jgi:hypothetical protein
MKRAFKIFTNFPRNAFGKDDDYISEFKYVCVRGWMVV